MKQTQAIIAIVALVIGFAGGFVLRPVIVPSAPVSVMSPAAQRGIERPSEAEATAAVRRFRVGFQTFSEATLTLGDCGPGTLGPGVTCMTNITLRPGSSAQNRTIGFARVGDRWEVSHW